MDDQPVIPFDVAGIVQIIMDAMAIERQRRIPKQQGRGKADTIHRFGIFARHGRDRFWRDGICILAVHQILPFRHAQRIVLPNLVAQCDKPQRPAAAILALVAFAYRALFSRRACGNGTVKIQPSAGPHPPGQPHVRDQTANLGVAIAPQRLWGFRVPEIKLMKERRKRIARTKGCVVPQCDLKCRGAGTVHHILFTLFCHRRSIRFEGSHKESSCNIRKFNAA